MRGRPAIGSMMRNSCGGRNTRPNWRKRGAKSVIFTLPPLRSVSTVETIAVLRTYSDWNSAMSSSTTSENPFSSFPDTSRQKIGSPSNRG